MDHPHVLSVLIPFPYQSLSRPQDVVLLRPLGLGPEWAVDFVLNHWQVLWGEHAVNIYDVVQTVFEECVHANHPFEMRDKLDLYIEDQIDNLIEMLMWMFNQLRPYLGNIPIERAAEMEYIAATVCPIDHEATLVEIGLESDGVWEDPAS